MTNREKLNSKFKEIVDNVYYQPPDGFQIKYPCIVYNKRFDDVKTANNIKYVQYMSYNVVIMSKSPNDEILYKILNSFTMSKLDSEFVVDGVYHTALTLYYNI